MKQEFNLLGSATQGSPRTPSAMQVAVAAGAVLAVALAAGAWIGMEAGAAEKRIQAANTAIDDLMLSLQERSQFLAQRNADPGLVAKLQQLERESTDKGKVLDLLAGRTLGNTAGFSGHLAALGRRYPDGLWLRHVAISDGGRQMAIQGRATEPALVPRFIAALRAEPAFQGTTFERFELARTEGGTGPVRFTLATAAEESQ
jgi:Fimbrial assembly protein (PilN)